MFIQTGQRTWQSLTKYVDTWARTSCESKSINLNATVWETFESVCQRCFAVNANGWIDRKPLTETVIVNGQCPQVGTCYRGAGMPTSNSLSLTNPSGWVGSGFPKCWPSFLTRNFNFIPSAPSAILGIVSLLLTPDGSFPVQQPFSVLPWRKEKKNGIARNKTGRAVPFYFMARKIHTTCKNYLVLLSRAKSPTAGRNVRSPLQMLWSDMLTDNFIEKHWTVE